MLLYFLLYYKNNLKKTWKHKAQKLKPEFEFLKLIIGCNLHTLLSKFHAKGTRYKIDLQKNQPVQTFLNKNQV